MAFSVSVPQDELAEKVATVARAISARTIVPALAGIYIRANADSLTLSATDMDLSVRTSLPTIVLGEGDVLVPGRLLAKIVRVLPVGDVALELDEEASTLNVRAGKASYKLNVLDADDFPNLPDAEAIAASEDGAFFDVDHSAFLEAVAKVSVSVSADANRPVLTGILVRLADGKLTTAATDSYRLSVYETEVEHGGADFEAIVPARALAELARSATGETIRVVTDERRAVFETGDTTLSSRLLDGEFPKYEQIIPSEFEFELDVDREKLLEVVRRTAIVARSTNQMRLSFTPKQLTVSAKADVGESKEDLAVPFSGELLEVGINPTFLVAGLEAFAAEKVSLGMVSPLRPLLFSDGDGLRHLVMPVRLPSA